jgi:hypothetical protein
VPSGRVAVAGLLEAFDAGVATFRVPRGPCVLFWLGYELGATGRPAGRRGEDLDDAVRGGPGFERYRAVFVSGTAASLGVPLGLVRSDGPPSGPSAPPPLQESSPTRPPQPGRLVDRLPAQVVIAGTPHFWEQVWQEMWESVRTKRQHAGLCLFDERPDGLLLRDLERRREGADDRASMSSGGGILWRTHGVVGDFAFRFSKEDLAASDASRRPLAVFSFGRMAPGLLAPFLGLSRPAAMLAAVTIGGILDLERRGAIPPNLLRHSLRGNVHVPGRGDFDVLRVDGEAPRSLDAARPVDEGGYLRRALEAVLGGARNPLVPDP